MKKEILEKKISGSPKNAKKSSPTIEKKKEKKELKEINKALNTNNKHMNASLKNKLHISSPKKDKINKVESAKIVIKNPSKGNTISSKHMFTNSNSFSLVNLQPYKYGNMNLQSTNIVKAPGNENEKTDQELKEFIDNGNRLKELVQNLANTKKNATLSTSSLNKVRTILLSWLKGENDIDNLEYSSFITEKKIRYLLKNKEKMESRIKILENEINNIKTRMNELKVQLTDIYVHYDHTELKKDIERFENSVEIKNKLNQRMVEKLEEMKRMLPIVKEYTTLKEQDELKNNEKAEILKICKGSIQTLNLLSNYYKNLKKKSIDEVVSNKLSNAISNCNFEDIHSNIIHGKEQKMDKNFSTFRNNDKKAKFFDKEKEIRPKSANVNKK
jgi:hypothetical protein